MLNKALWVSKGSTVFAYIISFSFSGSGESRKSHMVVFLQAFLSYLHHHRICSLPTAMIPHKPLDFWTDGHFNTFYWDFHVVGLSHS